MRQVVVLRGDAQAEALVQILQRAPSLSERYAFAGAASFREEGLANCVAFYDQVDGTRAARKPPELAATSRYVRFPKLRLDLLWPFACSNPYDAPSASHGARFPYGDAYVVGCLDQDFAPEAILDACFGVGWSDSWPDLEGLYASECERLRALDARSDVAIGAFVLECFRTRRLFAAVDAPADALLCELAAQMLRAADLALNVDALQLAMREGEELLGEIEVPVHPTLAEHFRLKWCDRATRYRNGALSLSYARYFELMVEAGAHVRAERKKLVETGPPRPQSRRSTN